MTSSTTKSLSLDYKFNNKIIFLILIIPWFPIFLSNYLPGRTEIFPWGFILLFFLNGNSFEKIIFFSYFSLIYTMLIDPHFVLFNFIKSLVAFLNIFIIYFFFKYFNFSLFDKIFKKALTFVIYSFYVMFFLELTNLDTYIYNFSPLRLDEPGFLSFEYMNRFNFFESEPSRASIFLFTLSIISTLVLKNGKFLIINFLIDLIFIRSLTGYLLWFLFFILYKKNFKLFFLLFIIFNIVFPIDARFEFLINSLFTSFENFFISISHVSGHRLPGLMIFFSTIFNDFMGFGNVDTAPIIQKNYLVNKNTFDPYIEVIQMQLGFEKGIFTLESPFINLLFSYGLFGFFLNILILIKIFENFNKKKHLIKAAILTVVIVSLFAIGKGVPYPWILFGLVNNSKLKKYFCDR